MTYKVKFEEQNGSFNECYLSASDLHELASYLVAFPEKYAVVHSIELVEDDSKLVSIR